MFCTVCKNRCRNYGFAVQNFKPEICKDFCTLHRKYIRHISRVIADNYFFIHPEVIKNIFCNGVSCRCNIVCIKIFSDNSSPAVCSECNSHNLPSFFLFIIIISEIRSSANVETGTYKRSCISWS